MNEFYEALMEGAKSPQPLIDCLMGRIRHPLFTWANPPDWYGFPPALIPVWSEQMVYHGYWKHSFSSRQATFVKAYVDTSTVMEIARTPEQFYCHAIVAAVVVEGTLESSTARFALELGVTNLEDIEAVEGDDPEDYRVLPQFFESAPLASHSDERTYTGDFPSGELKSHNNRVYDSCTYEFPSKVLRASQPNAGLPPWFHAPDIRSVFADLMKSGDLHGAWLALNSTGWTASSARDALLELSELANDRLFSMQAFGWIEYVQSRRGFSGGFGY